LTHRQDRAAVAAAAHVLAWLQKSAAEPGRLHPVYLDECEVHTHPYLAKVWRRRGVPLKIPAAGEDEKFGVLGALDYVTGQLVIQSCPRKGEEAFAACLETLAATLPPDEPVVIVIDNVGYHKSHVLRAQWRRLADHIEPFWLPAYTPQLNRMERVWRFLKQQLSCHRWWNDVDRLQQATETLLTRLEVHFHTEHGPAFHLVHNSCQSAKCVIPQIR
jgi:hypothetical protein